MHTYIKKCTVYPEYEVTEEELKQLLLCTLKVKKMNALKLDLAKNPTHCSNNKVDVIHIYAQGRST